MDPAPHHHDEAGTTGSVDYFASPEIVTIPPRRKTLLSRLCFPLLALLSRERTHRLGLVPIDDERVIMALRHARGRVLDVGCGSNLFVRSYGSGVGVDVFAWSGCDLVVEDAAALPFEDGSFDTISFLACLNHVPNREEAMREAARLLAPGGQVLVTMIPPRLGAFIHWLRERHDPDHRQRHIDHAHELMGMSERQVRDVFDAAGLRLVARKRFCYGTNSLFIATR
ncbi:MAG: class I SAM-dependent methyltransferase [Acidimicrobiales bacterium]